MLNVFKGCYFIKSIEIPSSVTSIGYCAFKGCAFGPTSISVAADNSRYDSRDNCNAIIETATNTLILGCKNTIIPNSVTSIGDYAFSQCENLTKITIPNSITSIGYMAFDECYGLKEVHISDITAWCGIDFSGGYSNPLVYAGNLYLNGELITELVIPNNVTSIDSYAFYGCTGLTSITSLIPADALFTVDSYTFYNVDKNVCTLYVPVGAKSAYSSTASWSEFTNIVELEPTEVTVTINQYGNATYCSPFALDFSEVEGLKAYAATGYNKVTQVVTSDCRCRRWSVPEG